VALLLGELDVSAGLTSSRGVSHRIPTSLDGSPLPTFSSNSYRTRGVGVAYRRDQTPLGIFKRYFGHIWSRIRPVFHLAHGGYLRWVLLSCLDIDNRSMAWSTFHIAHGGSLRLIDFARGYGITSYTHRETVCIGRIQQI